MIQLEEHFDHALKDSAANRGTCDLPEVSRKRRATIITGAKRGVVEQVECFQSKIQIQSPMKWKYARDLGVVLKIDWVREGVSTDVSLGSGYGVQDECRLIQIRPGSIGGSSRGVPYFRVVVYRNTGNQVGAVATVGRERFVLSFCDREWRAANETEQATQFPIVQDIFTNAVQRKITLKDNGGVEVMANI